VLSGIDHVLIASPDPDADADELEALLGLTATGGGRHEAHGTFNRLIWLGDSYVELMGVFDKPLAERSWWGAHMIKVLARGQAGYAGLALASDDLGADIGRLRGQGAQISEPIPGERRRPDGETVRWRIARLSDADPDVGLCFLIEHDTRAAEWRPDERAKRAGQVHPLGTTARIARVELPVRDVRAVTLRLLRELGLLFRPSLAGRGARDASLGSQTLRVSTVARPVITIRAGDAARHVDALGVSWELLPYS
jgi:hypothetical protein